MIGVSMVGADGSSWDLRNGPIVLAPGLEGFGLPKFERPTTQAPGVHGQRLQGIGSRAVARSGIFPCMITPQVSEAGWLALQRAWWRAWDSDTPALLKVTDPIGGVRTLRAYLDSDDGYDLELEPTVNLFERVPVSWVADDPWWYGPTQQQRIDVATGGDWLAGGTAPPFQFAPAITAGNGTLSNPGEVPAWPVYTLGPGTATFSVTVNGQTTAGAITVPTGGSLVIDTDPNAQTALLTDSAGNVTNVTPQLSAIAFAQVPVGAFVPVVTQLTGGNGASLTVAIAPRYRRAF